MKLRPYDGGYHFYCPACDRPHGFSTRPGGWQFNGDQEHPTVTPSLLTTGSGDPNYRCHLFIVNGTIQYTPDSRHAMAGKTVEIPEWPRTEGWKNARIKPTFKLTKGTGSVWRR